MDKCHTRKWLHSYSSNRYFSSCPIWKQCLEDRTFIDFFCNIFVSYIITCMGIYVYCYSQMFCDSQMFVIPKCLLLFPNVYCYSQMCIVIPKCLLLFPKVYCYSQICLLFPNMCYSQICLLFPNMSVIPKGLLLFPNMSVIPKYVCYSQRFIVIPKCLVLFPNLLLFLNMFIVIPKWKGPCRKPYVSPVVSTMEVCPVEWQLNRV